MDLSKYQPNREFLLYKTDSGDIKVDVLLQNETIWLPQSKIAELFEVQRPAITKHLNNIFESGELDEKVVCSILELTTQHGAITGKTQSKPTKFYNPPFSRGSASAEHIELGSALGFMCLNLIVGRLFNYKS